jgi:octopine/nopaline transport system permease protein
MDPVFMWECMLEIIGGAWLTFKLVSISILIGFFLAIGCALLRMSKFRVVSNTIGGYVFVIRGTPLIVQLFLIYYGLGQLVWLRESFLWEFFREPFWCAILALTVNTTAYGSEIIRGGIQAVPWGQIEAARACGMSRFLLFRRVIFPIGIRQALPAYGNEIILMVKATSLASTITILEMTGIARSIIAVTFRPIEVFIVAGTFYLLFNFVATRIIQLVEYRLMGHLRPPPAMNGARA